MDNLDIITALVIAANALFSYKGFSDISFFNKYKFNVGAIKSGDQIRLLSSGFLHADTAHLIFNMFTLYFFAPVVIGSLGNVNFVIIYAISLVFGSLLSLYFHKNESHYTAVGASGAVTGVLYASILLHPSMSLYLFFIPIPIPAYIFGIGYLLYSIYGMKSKSDNIGHDAHFGGAIGGYATTLLLMPSLFNQHLNIILLLLVPIVLLLVLKKTGKL